jgi:serine protease Do
MVPPEVMLTCELQVTSKAQSRHVSGALEPVSSLIASAAARVGPAVVGLGRRRGVGSGVVVEPGRVLTNAHNVRDREVAVVFADGRQATGAAVGADAERDLAALEVETGDVEPVEWNAQAAAPPIGAAVLALGNPGGRGLRVTAGFVSASPRELRVARGRRPQEGIEHTGPLPRGSSGGPLLDSGLGLLGLNTVRLEGGLILAVACDRGARERYDAIVRGTARPPRRLGVALASPRAARRLRGAVGLDERDGLLVRLVEDGTPAARAGLASGDLIVAAGGRDVDGFEALYEALDAVEGDGPLRLGVVRGEEERDVDVSFGAEGFERPA